ncbi:MAG TPA: hypothetical protein IAB56_00180 [Candidatus Scybalousia intestinigallinarum]|nr:hypothetical protein [Candidatus Scybalousia intestinigallinarum]
MHANGIVQELSELHQEELPLPKLKQNKWVVIILIIGVVYVAIFIKLEKGYKVELVKTETNYRISLLLEELRTIKEIGTIVINNEKYSYQIVSVKEKNNTGVDIELKLDGFSSNIDMLEGKIVLSSSTVMESIYRIIRKE